jgi:hypothetical protein
MRYDAGLSEKLTERENAVLRQALRKLAKGR